MTWYASEVLARCSDALLSAIMNEPKLAQHAYLLREPIEYELNGTTDLFIPPREGLLVLRPVCDPDEHCASWHDSEVISWFSLSGPPELAILAPQMLGEHVDEDVFDEFPPMAFLRYLKHLSVVTGADLAFFYCFMWGGDTETEYCWTFGRREELSLVLQSGVTSTVAKCVAGSIEVIELDLLSDTLAFLNASVSSPFCIFHTRGFPWEHYKILQNQASTDTA